ncbi:RteC domain-containing protein [Flavobacterium psychroterrae]|nr:RteC domain-containing protein [Flavobacterium psychroterrae]
MYAFFLNKINRDENQYPIFQNGESTKDLFWTDSKNALIELIYALYSYL